MLIEAGDYYFRIYRIIVYVLFEIRNKCFVAVAVTQVKAVVLDPRNLFSVDRTLTKDDVQRLIQVLS